MSLYTPDDLAEFDEAHAAGRHLSSSEVERLNPGDSLHEYGWFPDQTQ